LGLTGGIVDIGGLADCLSGIYENKADVSILDKYNEIRSKIYKEVTDPVSSENLVRLCEQDPEKALDNDKFLQFCKKAETDAATADALQKVSYQRPFGLYVMISSLTGLLPSYRANLLTTSPRGKTGHAWSATRLYPILPRKVAQTMMSRTVAVSTIV